MSDVDVNAQDVIERLCKLQQEVYSAIDSMACTAADCFCGRGGFWGGGRYDGTAENGYRNDMKAVEFIEDAVRKAIKEREESRS